MLSFGYDLYEPTNQQKTGHLPSLAREMAGYFSWII